MAKEAYYFSHDATAQHDVKCVKLRRELGWEGYGLFWALIETLRGEPDHKLPLSALEDLAFVMHTSKEKLHAIVTRYELFVIDNEFFFSARLNRSMSEYNSLKNKLVEAGRKGGLSRAKAMLEQPSSIKGKEIKGNERKVKESKGKEVEYPTQQQVVDFFGEKGYTKESALRAFDYYASNAWKDKNDKPVKNWKQKFISVWFKPENKVPEKKPVVIRPQDYWNRAEYLKDCEKHGIVPEVDEYAAR